MKLLIVLAHLPSSIFDLYITKLFEYTYVQSNSQGVSEGSLVLGSGKIKIAVWWDSN